MLRNPLSRKVVDFSSVTEVDGALAHLVEAYRREMPGMPAETVLGFHARFLERADEMLDRRLELAGVRA